MRGVAHKHRHPPGHLARLGSARLLTRLNTTATFTAKRQRKKKACQPIRRSLPPLFPLALACDLLCCRNKRKLSSLTECASLIVGSPLELLELLEPKATANVFSNNRTCCRAGWPVIKTSASYSRGMCYLEAVRFEAGIGFQSKF